MDNLKEKAIRGAVAKLFAQAFSVVLRLGSLMALARILTPDDFGVVAMVTTLIGVLSLFRDFGLSTATIQRTSITEIQLSTLFWINVLVGTVLAAITCAAAPMIARLYDEPRLIWISVVLAASFVINAIGIQHTAILHRQMRFTTLAKIDIGTQSVSTAIGIVMALTGFGYWSLVGMAVVGPAVSSGSSWTASRWIPGVPRRNSETAALIRVGGVVTLNGIIVYIAYNLEKILLGRFWGSDALGIYGRAYQLINMPTETLNSAVGGVTLSALSRLRHDPSRQKRFFLRAYSLLVAMTLPIAIACALFSSDIIYVLLGPKWSAAAPIFLLLTPTILVFAMINPFWPLLVSLGLLSRSLWLALALAPLVIAGYLIGLPFGPKGVALGFSTVMVFWLVPHIAWTIHGTGILLREIFISIGRPLISAISASLLTAGIVFPFLGEFSPLARLALGLPFLCLTYFGILFTVLGQWDFYADFTRTLMRRPATHEEGDR